MKQIKKILVLMVSFSFFQVMEANAQDADPEYVKVTLERADKIVQTLDISDEEKKERVKQTIAKEYRDLSALQDKQSARLEAEKKALKDNPEKWERKKLSLENKSQKELDRLRKSFLTSLKKDLNEGQITAVKDGLTYNVAPNTYQVYVEMLPELTTDQKEFVQKNLVEAREHAFMAGSSKDKHAWFGKYKGRINNYLAAEGYNLKEASEIMEAKMREKNQ
ncbi:DUF3826 domain-containing protein [Algoriphagus sp. NG3]|uniref:DUF3826 domain-containing protein n=1 Tax=Algoriphagus sp. NG3 TaxID=3097546 RepID=UPI002A83E705|nr:DUF3826 domain-containing protein [Algoriphagus sp. NG3]WPR77461.1 DUF3826 domain-containing protein [Algoriphagus sp. NG3]